VPVVIFTGGEPFERLDVLESGVGAAREARTPSAVFTSSYWGRGRDQALATLRRLDGLEELYLSSDVFHQKTVPYEKVHNVIAAADELAIPRITICIIYAKEEDRLAVRAEYARYGARVRYYEERVIPTPFLDSWVTDGQGEMRGTSPAEYESSCWIDTPIVNPNGYVFACHVGKVGAHGDFREMPYWLGSLRERSFAGIMEDAARNARYQFLRTQGPAGVAELFQAYPRLKDELERTRFSARCDMCFSVLSTKAGREALSDYVARADVRERINISLLARFGEPPMPEAAIPVAGAVAT
jgi:hypothetical protein